MLKSLQNALKVKDIRNRLLFTLLMIVVVRLGSQLPVPGTDPAVIKEFLSAAKSDNNALSLVDAFTGGSFEKFSLMTLSITPYITSSIIMQLMTLAIPALEELKDDGETGRKKIAEITRYVTVGLALLEGTAYSINFRNMGALGENDQWYWVIAAVLALTAGSAFLMWIGEQITEHGVGNGISIVLLVNILSRFPEDVKTLYEMFIRNKKVAMIVLVSLIILAVIIAVVVLVVWLNGATRRIPVQYAKRVQGRKLMGGNSSSIPLKVNTAGVIPVIFASSLMSIPMLITNLVKPNVETKFGKALMHVVNALYSGNWFRFSEGKGLYTLGFVLYVVLIIVFAYFYTSITFNPYEVASNLKKQGGSIPGVRPGKPTSEYLNRILNYIVFIGAVGLIIVVTIPTLIEGLAGLSSLSCGGTSMIIVVGVIVETITQIESKMLVRNYKGFLSE